MDARWRFFWAGFIMVTAGRSLILDAMGKEDYIASIQFTWVEWYISVPVAVVMLIIAAMMMTPNPPKEDQ